MRQPSKTFNEETDGPLCGPSNLIDDSDGVPGEVWRRGYQQAEAGKEGITNGIASETGEPG